MRKENNIWLPVVGYEGLYEISDKGDVKSLKKIVDKGKWGNVTFPEKFLKWIFDGYIYVNLYKNKKPRKVAVHVLVAKAFIPNPEKKPQVNHKDGNKHNPDKRNLEWVTHKENSEHASLNGLVARNFGEKNGASKLKIEDVLFIRSCGKKISRKKLSEKFNVTIKHIDRIRGIEKWNHV